MMRDGPEGIVARNRERLLERGERTRTEGLEAIRTFNPADFLGPDALASVFEQATRTSFTPRLRSLQATASRRGIRGPLSGAIEGDLAASFRRDLLAEVARAGGERARLTLGRGRDLAEAGGFDRAQGLELAGTELELALAREQREREESSRRRRAVGGVIGGIVGGTAGSFIPGLGTGLGASLGARLGSAFG